MKAKRFQSINSRQPMDLTSVSIEFWNFFVHGARQTSLHTFGSSHCLISVAIRAVALGLFLIQLTGCGYTVGKNFTRDIKTVAVPIFENDTNRRGLEFQLTEAVQNEITKRSPYRLAKGLEADTRLTGRIVNFRKDVLGETRYDDPRELQVSLMVKVTWEDLRSGKVLAEQEIPLSPESIPMATQSEMAPEIGQSLATAMDDAYQQMARKIVHLMEIPW